MGYLDMLKNLKLKDIKNIAKSQLHKYVLSNKLGELREPVTGVMHHREWRGVKDTAYDFSCWCSNWKDLALFFAKMNKTAVNSVFRYRWMFGYLTTMDFLDRSTAGQRDAQLRMSHLHYKGVVMKLVANLTKTLMYDKKTNANALPDDKVVLIDELIPPLIMEGFPNVVSIPAQNLPVFMVSVVNQGVIGDYLDVIESYGLPADVCPLPATEAAVAIDDDYPLFGVCSVTTHMPCDGGVLTSSIQDRRIDLPTHNLGVPLRYDNDNIMDYSVNELLEMIEFVEQQTNEKFDYDALRIGCERMNKQNQRELEKWEFNRTDLPQVTGSALWLYRLFYYQLASGTDDFLIDIDDKVNALITANYEKGLAGPKNIRHRAIIWSCPANYYTDFPIWLENCWGIVSVMDLETATHTAMIDTSTERSMLEGVSRYYQRTVMRKHTKGGYRHVLDELWKVVEEYNADMVLMYDQISCKGMDGLVGIFDEQARQRGVTMMWVQQDLMDAATISRRDMREQVNKFMYSVMGETPLDESIVDFDDSKAW